MKVPAELARRLLLQGVKVEKMVTDVGLETSNRNAFMFCKPVYHCPQEVLKEKPGIALQSAHGRLNYPSKH